MCEHECSRSGDRPMQTCRGGGLVVREDVRLKGCLRDTAQVRTIWRTAVG